MTYRATILRLLRSDRGMAMMEFAFAAPLVLTMGGFGTELANYATTQMRVSQIALTLADNASRIGSATGQSSYQVREADINDVLQGARVMGGGLNLTTNGRIILSSVENVQRQGSIGYSDHADDTAATLRLHWQRCVGKRGSGGDTTYASSYGMVSPIATAGNDTSYANRGVEITGGFGAAPAVSPPSGMGLIYVEINYLYQPVFGSLFMSPRRIHYVASFIVRDQRSYAQIYNPLTTLNTAVPRATCDQYTA